jgi:hypothetical protein
MSQTYPNIPIYQPFATNTTGTAGGRNSIPVSATGSNLASLADGFPLVCSQPVAPNGSGIPPQLADLNGILYEITSYTAWQYLGGLPQFDASIPGGYPLYACIQKTNGDVVINQSAGNTNNPNTLMTGWAVAYGVNTNNKVPLHGFWYDTTNLVYETTLSYNIGTLTLTITPTSSSFRIWNQGTLYTFTGAQTVTHTATQGVWYFYYTSSGILTSSQTAWNPLGNTLVAALYYDAVTPSYIMFDKRHHFDSSPEWVLSEYFANGTFVKNLLTDFPISGYTLSTYSNAANQWALGSGTVYAEDINVLTTAVPSAGPYNVVHLATSANNFVMGSAYTVPFIYNTSTSYIQYNQYTGGAWQMTDAATSSFVNYYIVATTGLTGQQIIAIPGQTTYTNLAAAQREQFANLSLQLFFGIEYVVLYQINYQVLSSASNSGKCQIVGVNKLFLNRIQSQVPTIVSMSNPMTALGDVIIGATGGSPLRLAGPTAATTALLTSTGTGSAANEPSWTNLAVTTSSSNTVTNKVSIVLGGVTYYLLASTSAT